MKKTLLTTLIIMVLMFCCSGSLFAATTAVTFRLIGDTQHTNGTEGHDKYVNWISTRTYNLRY